MKSDMIFDEIKKADVGDKVRLFGQKRRYDVMAKSDRYMIFSKNYFDTFIYTIFDFEDRWIGPDNLVFECYDFRVKEEAEEALKALEDGELELSRRRGISFDQYIKRLPDTKQEDRAAPRRTAGNPGDCRS